MSIPVSSSSVVGGAQKLYTFDINSGNVGSFTADELATAIKQCDGLDSEQDASTMHLAINTPTIPQVVLDALTRLRSFGVGLVVTHNGSSSHAPGPGFDPAALDAIRAASRSGKVWDPMTHRFVSK